MKDRRGCELLKRLMRMSLGRGGKSGDSVRSAVGGHGREPPIRGGEGCRHEVVIGKIAGIVIAHGAASGSVFHTFKFRKTLRGVNEAVHQRRTVGVKTIVVTMALKPGGAEILDAERVQL